VIEGLFDIQHFCCLLNVALLRVLALAVTKLASSEDNVSGSYHSSDTRQPDSKNISRVKAYQVADQSSRFELHSAWQLLIEHIGSGSDHLKVSYRWLNPLDFGVRAALANRFDWRSIE
jgi:hypothetical protein